MNNRINYFVVIFLSPVKDLSLQVRMHVFVSMMKVFYSSIVDTKSKLVEFGSA